MGYISKYMPKSGVLSSHKPWLSGMPKKKVYFVATICRNMVCGTTVNLPNIIFVATAEFLHNQLRVIQNECTEYDQTKIQVYLLVTY